MARTACTFIHLVLALRAVETQTASTGERVEAIHAGSTIFTRVWRWQIVQGSEIALDLHSLQIFIVLTRGIAPSQLPSYVSRILATKSPPQKLPIVQLTLTWRAFVNIQVAVMS